MNRNYIQSTFSKEEEAEELATVKDNTFEVPLRPQSLFEFAGQDQVRDRLDILIGAAKGRGECLGHCLFSGPPGLGKTTLAHILAKAMGTNLVITSGPVIEKAGDLAGLLTNLKEGDFLFIDEIHRLNPIVEEYLYPAMEDFKLDLVIDSGPNARSVQVPIKRFCLVAATTRVGLLSAPLRSRFASRLDFYQPEVLDRILQRSSRILNLSIASDATLEIARRSRGTPRIANNLLRWVRDFAQMRANNKISFEVVCQALKLLSIDACGLDEMDLKILSVISDHYQGGPVGLNTIAVAIGEESHTVEEVYEPYLILQGFLKRTPRGREITARGQQHLSKREEKR
jgi:Holliday junction DNA helicase RuvB